MINRQQKQQQKVFKQRQKAKARQKAQQAPRLPSEEATSPYYLCPFDALYPDQAATEYGTLQVAHQDGTVVDDYTLIEYICSNPDCDCQKILLDVVAHSTHQIMAHIDLNLRHSLSARLSEDKPQSPFAETLLELIVKHKLSNPNYQAHLRAHYHQLKQATQNPTPEQAKVLRDFRDQ